MDKVVKFFGVGVGPGDPELITLKALKIVQAADVLCYMANASGDSMAREIVNQHILTTQTEYAIAVQMNKNRDAINQVYDNAARDLSYHLEAGKNVVILCQGDPLFYGSFIYLYERLAEKFECEIVPGINSISAVSAAAKIPLSYLSDRIAIVSARNNDRDINQALENYDSVIILKAGPDRPRLLELIQNSGRLKETVYVEKATNDEQRVYDDINHLPVGPGPYFSMFMTTSKR